MPTRPDRICNCGRRVAASTVCACQRARKAEADRRRPSAHTRGYDDDWRTARTDFLKTHRTCTCGKPATLVRHRISIRLRPDLRLDRSNWLPGCVSCNALDRERDKREGRQR